MRTETTLQTCLFVFLILAVFVGPVCAQLGDPNSLRTVDDYLRYAMLNNAELAASFEQYKAAMEEVPQAKALPDPEVQYGYFARQSEMQMDQMLGVMQMFPWFGRIEARADVAEAKAQAARQRYEAARLSLIRQVKEIFYEYSYLAVATDIAKENLELLKHFEEVARTKYMTSAATHPDIIRAQVELATMEYVLKSLEALREPTTAKLNSILNRPSDAELPWPSKERLVQVHIDHDLVVNMLLQSNPELAELTWEISAAKSGVELTRRNFYPNVGVGVEWTEFEKSGGNSGRDSVALMFRMNLPLWRDSYKAGEEQARAMVRQIQHQKTNIQNRRTAEAVRVLYDIGDSQRQMDLYGLDLIAKAQELVGASESAYKAGTVDFLSLIDAQRMLLQYRLDYERAVTNYQQKLAELEMLVGQEF
jgi:cobalt-zinc-cadmium efflux system outer membrane protein